MSCRLFHDDCLNVLPILEEKSIHLILVDLPYQLTDFHWDKLINQELLWKHYSRLLTPTGAVVLTASQPFTSYLVSSNPKWFKYEWIWEKTTPTGFPMVKSRPLKKHESILVFSPASSSAVSLVSMTYNPQGLLPYGKLNRRGSRGEGLRKSGIKSNSYIQEFTNYPTSILKFPSDKKRYHPSQKPLALMEYLINTYSNPDETVLDHCAGSGNTLIAGLKNNRKVIGVEKEEKYFNIIESRVSELI